MHLVHLVCEMLRSFPDARTAHMYRARSELSCQSSCVIDPTACPVCYEWTFGDKLL